MTTPLSPGARPAHRLQQKPLQQLVPRLKMARVLGLPEDSFGQMVLSVERHPLFRRFMLTDNPRTKLFSYQRFPKSGLSSGFLELKDDVSPAAGEGDVETLLEERRDLIALCRRIGRTNFESHFLYADRAGSPEHIARECGLTVEETNRLLDLTTQIGIRSEFYHAAGGVSPEHLRAFTRVADLEKDGEGFSIRYTSLRYGRGRYAIHYDNLEKLKHDNAITAADRRALGKLIQTMELINARRSTLHQILEAILEHQREFLKTGKEESLLDFTQEQLAEKLSVHPSTVSRAVASKSLGVPWSRELPLKDFLGRGSLHGVLSDLQGLVGREETLLRQGQLKSPYRDPQLAALLKKETGRVLAVRTIAKYRFLAGIPNIYTRAANSGPKNTTETSR